MFSSDAHKPHSLFAHLSLSYLAVYVVCALLFYLINAHVISKSARAFDRQDVRSASQEYSQILSHDNTGSWLAEEVSLESLPRTTLFAIRILSSDGRLLYAASQPSPLETPDGWQTQKGPPAAPTEGADEIWLPAYRRHLQLQTTRLPDGRFLQVAQSTSRERSQLRIISQTSLIFFLLASLFSIGNALWMIALTRRPLQQIASDMSRIITTGAVDTRPSPLRSRIAEVDHLSRMFNVMHQKNVTLITAIRETLDNVAHDFRTPLTRIRNAAEFALNTKPTREALLGTLADIIDDCDTARIQLQNLMDIRSMESGFFRLDIQRFDIKKEIVEILDLYAVLAEDKLITLQNDLPTDAVFVNGDPARLSQVVANLVDNAVKYTPKGGHIRVTLAAQTDRVTFAVADTGIGIPEEEHALIGQRLYRSRNARAEKGLGLGISLAKAIIDAHGGQLTFTSVLGQGSTFVLTLPLKTE